MGRKQNLWVLALCVCCLLGSCDSSTPSEPSSPPEESDLTPPEEPDPEPTEPVVEVPPPEHPQTPPGEPPPDPPPPPAPAFQPAFHQALRWSKSVGGVTTFRLRIPVGRAGERLRVTFRSGDGSLELRKATVARAGVNGALASEPVALTFNGSPGFSAGARKLVTSDPLAFTVGIGEELALSFEVRGALAMSAINAFPGGFVRSGAYAGLAGELGGKPWQQAIGVATVDVEAPPARAFVALGDSITEGYLGTASDTRLAWPSLVQQQLGLPVVNAAVSGEGFWDELQNLDPEVLTLSGVTDCLVLLGTNDLGAESEPELEARMTELLTRLKPFCRPWVSTLLPKERSSRGSYEQAKRDRVAFNAWIRQQTLAEVIDLEAVTRSPTSEHLFIDGLDLDGIHPSPEGHRVMAAETVRVLRERGGL